MGYVLTGSRLDVGGCGGRPSVWLSDPMRNWRHRCENFGPRKCESCSGRSATENRCVESCGENLVMGVSCGWVPGRSHVLVLIEVSPSFRHFSFSCLTLRLLKRSRTQAQGPSSRLHNQFSCQVPNLIICDASFDIVAQTPESSSTANSPHARRHIPSRPPGRTPEQRSVSRSRNLR